MEERGGGSVGADLGGVLAAGNHRGDVRVAKDPRERPLRHRHASGHFGGGDPLETIELRFSNLETAAGYCRRQGLDFSLHGAPGRQHPLRGDLPPESVLLTHWSARAMLQPIPGSA